MTLADEAQGLGKMRLRIDQAALEMIINYANGDARRALNSLEIVSNLAKNGVITAENVQEALQKRVLLYDKTGEEHFNLISALHKSLRNSDVDASLYWLVRMLASGDEPLYIARRLVRFASEDVGLADPQALAITLHAKEAYDFLGTPEGELALAEAVIYLASAPEEQPCVRCLPGRDEGRGDESARARTPPYPECGDAPHEGDRLRQGLSIRPRQRFLDHGHGDVPGEAQRTENIMSLGRWVLRRRSVSALNGGKRSKIRFGREKETAARAEPIAQGILL